MFVPQQTKPDRPPPPATPLLRNWGISVMPGEGCCVDFNSVERTFVRSKSIIDAEAVVVDNTTVSWHSPDALAARLHGKRLVDKAWLESNTKKGSCTAFQPWIHVANTTLWISSAFAVQHAKYVTVLKHAAANAPDRKGHAPAKKFQVIDGAMPLENNNSKSKVAVVSDSELRAMSADDRRKFKNTFDLRGLLAHCTALCGPERSVK